MRSTVLTLAALLLLGALPPAVGEEQVVELDSIAAVVDDDVITRLELARRVASVRKQLARTNTPAPPRAALERQVLERLIIEHLQLKLAERQGIRVDDEALNQVVGNIARENNLTLTQFREALRRDGYDFAEFREEIRNEVAIGRLRSRQVDNRVNVTPQEVDSFLKSQASRQSGNVEYRLSHILVAVPEASGPEKIREARAKAENIAQQLREGADFRQMAVTWSDGQQALNGGDLGWRRAAELPTLFSDRVLGMKPSEISGLIRSPSGFHLLKLEEKRGEKRHVVRQTHARHILIATNEITSDHDARTRLERLRDRILAGEDFAGLAKANSDDKGSASRGGDLGWANPGQFVPAFEQTMNRLATNQVSEPFQSQYGWHILQVLGRRNHDDTDEQKRNEAFRLLRQRKIEEERENWLRRLRDEAYVEYRLAE